MTAAVLVLVLVQGRAAAKQMMAWRVGVHAAQEHAAQEHAAQEHAAQEARLSQARCLFNYCRTGTPRCTCVGRSYPTPSCT